mgnify:CR=1 FL=1
MGQYTKMIIAVLAAAGQVAYSSISGGITPVEWVNIAIAGATVLGVYYGPNVPGVAMYTKVAFAALMAGLMAAVQLAIDGFSAEDLKPIGIAAANPVLVFLFPNKA